MELIGRKPEDISSNCFVDFFSIGHILFGYIAYMLFFSLFIFSPIIGKVEMALFMSQNVGFLWEFLENYLLINTKFKFQGKQDCLGNSLFDIAFVTGGGFLGALTFAMPNPFMIGTLASLGLFSIFKIIEKRVMGGKKLW